MLDQTQCALQHQLSNLDMVLRQFVEGGGDNFSFYRTLHIRYFLRAFIDKQNKQGNVRVIRRDTVRNLLKQQRLACLRRRHDESTLSKSNRS
ncbi:hypothetical protein D3C81_1299230 [compost metagenome]